MTKEKTNMTRELYKAYKSQIVDVLRRNAGRFNNSLEYGLARLRRDNKDAETLINLGFFEEETDEEKVAAAFPYSVVSFRTFIYLNPTKLAFLWCLALEHRAYIIQDAKKEVRDAERKTLQNKVDFLWQVLDALDVSPYDFIDE